MAAKRPKAPTAAPRDVLSEVLDAASIELVFAGLTTLRGQVGVAIPGNLDAALHVVLEGRVFVQLEGGEPLALEEGAFLVLPVDRAHGVADAPKRRLLSPAELPITPAGIGIALELGKGPLRARVLTAAFRMRAPWIARPLRVFPVAVVSTRDEAPRAWARAVELADELGSQHPGRDFLLRRGCEALLVEALRAELTRSPPASLMAGLGDRSLRLAIEAIHRDCAHEWTVEELARLAGSSRSVLAERFRTKLGTTPRQYRIDWRMNRAATLLTGTDLSVAEVAAAVGYASEPAFARTFKRATGFAPGRFRREQQG
jgi:AraC-like DNA-binding protein